MCMVKKRCSMAEGAIIMSEEVADNVITVPSEDLPKVGKNKFFVGRFQLYIYVVLTVIPKLKNDF